MDILDLMKEKKISKYRLSKESGVPYATLSDICAHRTDLKKCSAETVYRLAKSLEVSMEDLLEPAMEHRMSFDLFKSEVCHQVKREGDIDFLIHTLEDNVVETYYEKKWYPESYYVLAMIDYLSRLNKIPLCNKYDMIRKNKLSEPIFPSSIICLAEGSKDDKIKEKAIKESIPEFIKYNIVESEIRNVI